MNLIQGRVHDFGPEPAGAVGEPVAVDEHAFANGEPLGVHSLTRAPREALPKAADGLHKITRETTGVF